MKSPSSKNIILASNSPRRRALLKEIVSDFTIALPRDIDESYPSDVKAEEVAEYISRKKASAYADMLGLDDILITADTIVIVDNKILGKPKNEAEALGMLKTLCGKEHKVVTGMTLKSANKELSFSNESLVQFDNVNEQELKEYIKEFRPFDKAGSYGVQEWIGCRGIKRIEGCFYNIMGLPLNDLYNHLKAF